MTYTLEAYVPASFCYWIADTQSELPISPQEKEKRNEAQRQALSTEPTRWSEVLRWNGVYWVSRQAPSYQAKKSLTSI